MNKKHFQIPETFLTSWSDKKYSRVEKMLLRDGSYSIGFLEMELQEELEPGLARGLRHGF